MGWTTNNILEGRLEDTANEDLFWHIKRAKIFSDKDYAAMADYEFDKSLGWVSWDKRPIDIVSPKIIDSVIYFSNPDMPNRSMNYIAEHMQAICNLCNVRKSIFEFNILLYITSQIRISGLCKECKPKYEQLKIDEARRRKLNNPMLPSIEAFKKCCNCGLIKHIKSMGRQLYTDLCDYCGDRKIWASNSHRSHVERGFTVNFSKDELFALALSTRLCYYCGALLLWERFKGYRNKGASLDRTDNDKDMTLANCRIICRQCNSSKSTMPEAEFLAYVKAISDKFNRQ